MQTILACKPKMHKENKIYKVPKDVLKTFLFHLKHLYMPDNTSDSVPKFTAIVFHVSPHNCFTITRCMHHPIPYLLCPPKRHPQYQPYALIPLVGPPLPMQITCNHIFCLFLLVNGMR